MDDEAIDATVDGNLSSLQHCIESGADPNHRNEMGDTSVTLAAFFGHIDCFRYLLQHGGDVNLVNNAGDSAASLAAFKGRLDCLMHAVEQGADINIKNNNGDSIVTLAAYNGRLDCLRYAIAQGCETISNNNNGDTAITLAAFGGRVECLQTLVDLGNDINSVNSRGDTAVTLAAFKGRLECLKYAVGQGGNAFTVNKKGDSAMALAAFNGHLSCMEYLSELGVDMNSVNSNGDSPLTLAAYNGHLACVQFAVEKGADVTVIDSDGKTALDLACTNDHDAVATWLRHSAADAAAAALVVEKEARRKEMQMKMEATTAALAAANARIAELESGPGNVSSLPLFLGRLMQSMTHYVAGGGLAGATPPVRKQLQAALSQAMAEEDVAGAVAEWRDSGSADMGEVRKAVDAREAAIMTHLRAYGEAAAAAAPEDRPELQQRVRELQALHQLHNDVPQVMKQASALRLALAAADEAVETLECSKRALRRSRLRGEDVTDAGIAAADAQVQKANAQLQVVQGRMDNVQALLKQLQPLCPEVECKLSFRACADAAIDELPVLGASTEESLVTDVRAQLAAMLASTPGAGAGSNARGAGESKTEEATWQYQGNDGKWLTFPPHDSAALSEAWAAGSREAKLPDSGNIVVLGAGSASMHIIFSGSGSSSGGSSAVRRVTK